MKTKITAIIILGIVTLLVLIYAIHLSLSGPSVQNSTVKSEYGEAIKITAKDVFGDEKVNNFKVDTSSVSNQEGKDYPAIGTYNVKVTYNTATGTGTDSIKVLVRDTKGPTFKTAPKKIYVDLGQSDYDFSEDFEAKDLSGATLSFDTSKVDFDTDGTYDATVTATDKHDNSTEQSFKVIVGTGESQEDLTEDQEETTTKKSKKSKSDSEEETTEESTSTTTQDNGTTYYQPTYTTPSYTPWVLDSTGGYYDDYGNYYPGTTNNQTYNNYDSSSNYNYDQSYNNNQTYYDNSYSSGGYYDENGNYVSY